jgi:hypothetical protein
MCRGAALAMSVPGNKNCRARVRKHGSLIQYFKAFNHLLPLAWALLNHLPGITPRGAFAMKASFVAIGLGIFLCGGAALATTPGWLAEFMLVRAPQTQLVRDAKDPAKYYLCWQEGVTYYGIRFRRQKLEENLKKMPAGGRVSLSSVLAIADGDWTDRDSAVCWGQ